MNNDITDVEDQRIEMILRIIEDNANGNISLDAWKNSLNLMDNDMQNKLFLILKSDRKWVDIFNDNLNDKIEALGSGDMQRWSDVIQDEKEIITIIQ